MKPLLAAVSCGETTPSSSFIARMPQRNRNRASGFVLESAAIPVECALCVYVPIARLIGREPWRLATGCCVRLRNFRKGSQKHRYFCSRLLDCVAVLFAVAARPTCDCAD